MDVLEELLTLFIGENFITIIREAMMHENCKAVIV